MHIVPAGPAVGAAAVKSELAATGPPLLVNVLI
jgi:hypothetical protein